MLFRMLLCLAVAGVLIQVVPFGRNHSNPAVTGEPVWDSPRTRELARRACYNCHSNETAWPWYTNVAPVSWLVQRDVNGGRSHLNFSEWDTSQIQADDVVEEAQTGGMPPWFYLPMHPEARLSQEERRALVLGFRKSFGVIGSVK